MGLVFHLAKIQQVDHASDTPQTCVSDYKVKFRVSGSLVNPLSLLPHHPHPKYFHLITFLVWTNNMKALSTAAFLSPPQLVQEVQPVFCLCTSINSFDHNIKLLVKFNKQHSCLANVYNQWKHLSNCFFVMTAKLRYFSFTNARAPVPGPTKIPMGAQY